MAEEQQTQKKRRRHRKRRSKSTTAVQQPDEQKKGLQVVAKQATSLEQVIAGETEKRDQALLLLKQALSEAQEWEKALAAIQHIKDSALRDRSLRILSTRLVWAQQWDLAEQAVNSIRDNRQHSSAAIHLGEGLEKVGEYQRLLHLVQQVWCRAETREEAIQLLRLAQGLLSQQPDLGHELVQAFKKVDDFLY